MYLCISCAHFVLQHNTLAYFWKAVANHSQAASPLGEHSSVVLNYWLGKGRNYEKLLRY